MSDQAIDGVVTEPNAFRLKQAQAMLKLFEADRKRAAVTLEEIKEWAHAQDDEQLQFRVDLFLSPG